MDRIPPPTTHLDPAVRAGINAIKCPWRHFKFSDLTMPTAAVVGPRLTTPIALGRQIVGVAEFVTLFVTVHVHDTRHTNPCNSNSDHCCRDYVGSEIHSSALRRGFCTYIDTHDDQKVAWVSGGTDGQADGRTGGRTDRRTGWGDSNPMLVGGIQLESR